MTDDYTWPADPRITRLLGLFDQLHAEVTARVHQAPTREARDVLLQVVWRIETITVEAKQEVERPGRRPSPHPPAAPTEPVESVAPAESPGSSRPRSPLDPGWAWRQYEDAP